MLKKTVFLSQLHLFVLRKSNFWPNLCTALSTFRAWEALQISLLNQNEILCFCNKSKTKSVSTYSCDTGLGKWFNSVTLLEPKSKTLNSIINLQKMHHTINTGRPLLCIIVQPDGF